MVRKRAIDLAGQINNAMPDYVVSWCCEMLGQNGKTIDGSRILILGLAYKANVDDDRESQATCSWKSLRAEERKLGITILTYQLFEIAESINVAGRKSERLSSDFDLFLLVTNHKEFQKDRIVQFGVPVIDSRHLEAKSQGNWELA